MRILPLSSPFFLLEAAIFILPAKAQYTLYASVIFTSSGEKTPTWGGFNGIPDLLTPLGAQQLYAAGQYFKSRYTSPQGSSVNGTTAAPILGLSPYEVDSDQTFVDAVDNQYAVSSAQAFMQGLYPPVSASGLDAYGWLANGSYMQFPLSGYQYAQIHTESALSPTSIYVAGDANCPNQGLAAAAYMMTAAFSDTLNQTTALYSSLGTAVARSIAEANQIAQSKTWNYVNAYSIYEYLSYQYQHNATIQSILNSSAHSQQYAKSQWLASTSQFATYGDLSYDNGIQAIAGKTLASRILTSLSTNIATAGSEYKLSLLFGSLAPFTSFFALSSLPQPYQAQFYGLPLPASSMVFELFSTTPSNTTSSPSTPAYPSASDLWVRFLFRNGSTGPLQSYPLFNNGPDNAQLPWPVFEAAMQAVAVAGPGEWCDACGGSAVFCAQYNASYSQNLNSGFQGDTGPTPLPSIAAGSISPQVAGALGFAGTFAFFVLLLVGAALVGGIRFQRPRTPRRRRSVSAGGFKGAQKMESDADLSLPKNGAVVGVTVAVGEGESKGVKGERIGSWEMEGGGSGGAESGGRQSADDINPFREPVRPEERV